MTNKFCKSWWFILIIVSVAVLAVGCNEKGKFEWKDLALCKQLPKPNSNVGNIISNDDDYLDVNVENTSNEDFKAYIKKCQDMGYTVESENDGDYYNAFDKEGYKLSLSFYSSQEEMNIELEAPEQLGTLYWPRSEIANLLPKPKSTVGKVSSDSSDGCYIYVGETSLDEYNAYIDECAKKGFSVNYDKGDKFYNAEDINGNQLSVDYLGNNIMSIQIEAGETKVNSEESTEASTEKTEVTSKTKSTKKEKSSKKSSSKLRPEFKKAMDSYEEFMNEYCDFMEKYAKSDKTDLELLSDYSDYMSKYADAVEDFEAWDNEDLTTEEASYYLDVQTRINKKLLKVAE